MLFLIATALALPPAQTIEKVESCPSGYSSSGNYCVPASSAKYAILKNGSCPSGYSSSGHYCLASSTAKHAIPKNGSCPSGFSSSGHYCIESTAQVYALLTPQTIEKINSCPS